MINKTYSRKFESITEFNEYLQNKSDMPNYEKASIIERPRQDWDNNTSAEQAIDLLKSGWSEGVELLSELNVAVNKINNNDYVNTPGLIPSPQGELIDMAAYFSGSPEFCYTFQDTENKVPVLKIGVPSSISNKATSQDIINRGVALLSLINAIEANKINVELWAFSYNVNKAKNEDKALLYEIKIKASDEPFDLDKMAFICIHPAFCRRIMWIAKENEPKEIRKIFGIEIEEGYAYPLAYESNDYDLLPDFNLRAFRTPGSAKKWVRENALKAGINIEEETLI